MKMLAPSILSADFSKLGEQVVEISKAGADYVHVDVMDGNFVPNISFGAYVMKSLDKLETAPYDVHLMIADPDKYIPDFVTEKTEYIVFHQEASKHIHRTVQLIHSFGKKAGIALNPATPISSIECMLNDVELVLVMSVNPGFGGQKLIPFCIDKIRELDRLRKEKGYNYIIEIDGGVTLDNVDEIYSAGCDLAVAGSAVFGAESLTERVKEFKDKNRY